MDHELLCIDCTEKLFKKRTEASDMISYDKLHTNTNMKDVSHIELTTSWDYLFDIRMFIELWSSKITLDFE